MTQQNRYNGDGQRIQKVEGSKTTNYYYQDGVVAYTTDAAGTQTSQNLIGTDGNIIATQRYAGDNTGYYLYNKDIQGSSTSLVKEDGSADSTYQYTDFGETTINGDDKAGNEVCYTGGIYDQSTGLYYLNARYYDPEDGRFVTEDTYRGEITKPETAHLYVYCANNPVNYVDPSGHKKKFVGFGAQVGVASTNVGFVDINAGLEVVWYTSKRVKVQGSRLVPYLYGYGEVGTNTSKIKNAVGKIYSKFIKNPAKLLGGIKFSCSLCFFGIWGNTTGKKFVNADSYNGGFQTTGVSFLGVKGYKSSGATCVDYGGGKNIGKGNVFISSSTYVRLNKKGNIFQKIGNKIKKKAEKYIKKAQKYL